MAATKDIPKNARLRSYKMDVLPRIRRLERRYHVTHLGDLYLLQRLPLYPCYALSSSSGGRDTRLRVLISGGVHGDEPAGVFAVLEFLESHASDYSDSYRFLAYPCMNPSGFELGTEKNARGLDVNHAFTKRSSMQEVRFVRDHLKKLGIEFLFTVDMHEAFPHDKFFMWEICPDRSLRVGHEVVRKVEQIAPIWDKKRMLHGDINSGGVIFYPEGARSKVYSEPTTFEQYLELNHTSQAMTFETSTGWDLELRIKVHIRALRAALDSHPLAR